MTSHGLVPLQSESFLQQVAAWLHLWSPPHSSWVQSSPSSHAVASVQQPGRAAWLQLPPLHRSNVQICLSSQSPALSQQLGFSAWLQTGALVEPPQVSVVQESPSSQSATAPQQPVSIDTSSRYTPSKPLMKPSVESNENSNCTVWPAQALASICTWRHCGVPVVSFLVVPAMGNWLLVQALVDCEPAITVRVNRSLSGVSSVSSHNQKAIWGLTVEAAGMASGGKVAVPATRLPLPYECVTGSPKYRLLPPDMLRLSL